MTVPTSPPTVTACVIVIGNEILSGRIQDTNLYFLAGWLNRHGIRLREVRVVADDQGEIVAAVNACRSRYDYVLTTGGIGPTHDDITTAAIAVAFGVAVVRDPEAMRRLESHYGQSNLNDARVRMADIPAGATLIDNPVSMAPGFQIGNVFVLAGVPMVMQAMAEGLGDRLTGGEPMLSRTVSCELAEGVLSAGLEAVQRRWPDLEIGSYPYFRNGFFGVSLVLRGTNPERLDAGTAETAEMVRALGGVPKVIG
ncbi:Molybdenum cofactor biosynthesis protein [uncultured Gammaproteobacteria bacterium]